MLASGQVEQVEVIGSSGHEALDVAGLKVAQQLRYEPGRSAAGVPENTVVQMSFVFDPNLRMKREGPRDAAANIMETPVYTPYTDMPSVANREAVQRALLANYPAELRKAGTSGTVLVWLLIDENGNVANTMVDRSANPDGFGYAALNVAKSIKFTPALNNGTPVKVWIKLPIVFKPE